MDNTTLQSGSTALAEVPTVRSCTRCEGQQHLIGEASGLGKYRCDVCELEVGFDLEADLPEFLLHRGQPSLYTKDRFGSQLFRDERRLP